MELFSGAPYDYTAVAGSGSIVFTAGACPIDANGTVVSPGDHVVQADCAYDNLLVEIGGIAALP